MRVASVRCWLSAASSRIACLSGFCAVSAFIGTTLEKYLRTNSIKNLVIAGFTTNHCV